MAYSKYNIIYQLQKWLDSVAGQTFLNYAYSWGASIVILGTLFKLTHLPGANIMLYIGMGTEVIVFFISAFDRPFDKTTDGMVLATASDKKDNENIDIPEDDMNEENNLQELNKVYDKQAQTALETLQNLDEINIQAKQAANKMAEINAVYDRVLTALTGNPTSKAE